MSPRVGLGDILLLPWSSVRLSVTKSCPLCNSKTVRDIFMKLYTNVNNMRRRAERNNRNSGLCILELWPFEIENSRFCDMVVAAL